MSNGDLYRAVKVVHTPAPRSLPPWFGVIRVRSGRAGAGRILRAFQYRRRVRGSFGRAVQAATLWARQNALEVYLEGEAEPVTKF